MSGKMIQDAAVAQARTKGYIAAHFATSRVRQTYVTNYAYDSKGFPDLVLVSEKKKRMVVVEVKGDGDSLRPEQEMWLRFFEAAGIPTLILTSKAWRAGELDALL